MKPDIGIHFIIAIFIWLVSWTAAIDLEHKDLNTPYKICGGLVFSCPTTDDNKDVVGKSSSRKCQCDEACDEYGDCCTNSPYFYKNTTHRNEKRFECVRVDGSLEDGVYVVNKCPAEWTDRRVRDACEAPADYRDGMLNNPVTSRATGHGYRNRFCALCNGDTVDPVLWDTRLVCENLLNVSEGAEQSVVDTLRYDGARWTVTYLGQVYRCEQTVVPPAGLGAPRPCVPRDVVTCQPHWSKEHPSRSDCEGYTAVVYKDDVAYKNIHCAMCNDVFVHHLACPELHIDQNDNATDIRSRFPIDTDRSLRSFTTLFTVRPNRDKCTGDDQFYDPFGKTCRTRERPVFDRTVPLNCSSAVAVYVVAAADWHPSDSMEYVTLDNGSVAVCEEVRDPRRPVAAAEAFGSVTITYVGLGVSTIFLLVHLAVFAALPEMKNLSGKNLASFCVSLVCSYAAFVAGNWLTGPACYADAAFTYYAFLTSFTWMLVMSFDCWRSLRLATVELRITTGRQTKKFLVYSAVCWLVPAMLTFVAVAADAVPAVPDRFRPRFGAAQCWFGSKTALLVFFAGPLSAVMAVNLSLFVWTAYLIHSSRATIRHVNTRHVRRDFRMYCRLAVLMGLTWSTGIVASYTDSRYMWILFVALNTFQGLFVFVAFTCRRRFLDLLVGRASSGHDHDHHDHKDNKSPGAWPTSFSLSSSDHSVPISSEKTTDTLY
uniref:G-protein coupled receptor n=1 Tax=Sipha flava TaxID=143950 RepID=A0A2S2R669_9HEMI